MYFLHQCEPSMNGTSENNAPMNDVVLTPRQHPTPTRTRTPTPIPISTKGPEITIHLQVDRYKNFSTPYPKAVLRTKVSTEAFFKWFSEQTGHPVPEKLEFTLTQAMPPLVSEVSRGHEDHFRLLKRYIKDQTERTKDRLPGLANFVILVAVPVWHKEDDVEKEEE